MPQGSSAVRPTNGLYLYLYLKWYISVVLRSTDISIQQTVMHNAASDSWTNTVSILRLKCDGTRAETRFRLPAKRMSPLKSAWASVHQLLAIEVCASAVVMLDTPCTEVVWRVLATHSIHQFPSCASPRAITFQLDSTSAVDGVAKCKKF